MNSNLTREQVYRAYLERYKLVTGGVVEPHWTPDGAAVCFTRGTHGDKASLRVDFATGDAQRLDLTSGEVGGSANADSLQDLQERLGWKSSEAERFKPRMWKRGEYLIGKM